MKFCYVDESGTGNEPYAVMVGIIADAYRMHITKQHWSGLLTALSELLGNQISEVHTADFYAGNGVWRRLEGSVRAEIISEIFDWLKDRNHKIVYSAIDKTKFTTGFHTETQANEIGTLWRFMALHICLALQKQHQQLTGNKGHTLLIFDKQEIESGEFIKFIKIPPQWTNSYYRCQKNQEQLDQIIDVPYFADSHHVGLIQLADFVSFFMRKYIEIQTGLPPDYEDEPERIQEWANIALQQSIPKSAIYMTKGRCECADLFYRYAPACLL
jgi:hypothetical protein